MKESEGNSSQDVLIAKDSLRKLIGRYQNSDAVSKLEKAASLSKVIDLPLAEAGLFPLLSSENIYPPSLSALEASIKANGIMVPLFIYDYLDRPHIINGVKRYIAAQRLGLKSVPAVYLKGALSDVLAYVINNIMTNQDNKLVEAYVFSRLMSDFGFREKDIRDATSLSHGQINNLLRLNRLEPTVRKMLIAGSLSYAKARLLVVLDGSSQESMAEKLKGLSVRECEEAVRDYKKDKDETGLGPDAAKKLRYRVSGTEVIVTADNPDDLRGLIAYLRERGKRC